jgi:hypothetical protein
MRLFHLILTALAIFLAPIAYSQITPDNPLLAHLPPKSTSVFEANLAGLMAKVDLAALLGSVPSSGNAHSQLIAGALKDPGSAGVDLSRHIFVAQTAATGLGADSLQYIYILFALSDSAKFRAALSNAIPNLHVHHVIGKGFTIDKDNSATAWNNRLAVMTIISHKRLPGFTEKKTEHPAKPANPHPLTELATAQSLAALAGYSSSPWLTDQRFLSGFASNDDFHAWNVGSAGFAKTFSKLGTKIFANKMMVKDIAPSPIPAASDSNRNPVLYALNFASGRIALNTTQFVDSTEAGIARRAFDRPVDPNLAARLPDGLLLGWAGMHINLNAIGDLLDKFHTRKSLDSILSAKSLTISDFTGALNGDFLVAALAADSNSADTGKKKPTWYVVVGLNDPARLWQLAGKLSLFKDSTMNTAPDTTQKPNPFKNLGSKFVIRDNLLVISDSREKARQYFDHTGRRQTDQSDPAGGRIIISLNLKAVSSFLGNSGSGNPKTMMAARVLEKLDKFTISSSAGDGNNFRSSLQITMADPSANSLQTLLSIMH